MSKKLTFRMAWSIWWNRKKLISPEYHVTIWSLVYLGFIGLFDCGIETFMYFILLGQNKKKD